jgi:hypothetical protein
VADAKAEHIAGPRAASKWKLGGQRIFALPGMIIGVVTGTGAGNRRFFLQILNILSTFLFSIEKRPEAHPSPHNSILL